MSLKDALEALGYKTYHMTEVMPHNHFAVFNHAFDTGDAHGALSAMRDEGFNASLDFPSCLLFAEQLEMYPEAKVILSVRDSGEQWARSVRETIGGVYRPAITGIRAPWRWLTSPNVLDFAATDDHLWRRLNISIEADGGINVVSAAAAYERWVAHVKNVVPAKQLLVFSVKEGWRPVCSFLGVVDQTLCSGMFPRVNEAADMKAWLKGFHMVAECWPYFAAASTLFLAISVRWFVRRCCA